jgi:hypothetical protein
MLLAIDQSDAELLLRARQISVLGKIKTKVLCGGGENLVAMSISMTGHRGTVLAIYNWMSVLRISIMFLKCTLKYKSGILMISSASFETVFPAARQ